MPNRAGKWLLSGGLALFGLALPGCRKGDAPSVTSAIPEETGARPSASAVASAAPGAPQSEPKLPPLVSLAGVSQPLAVNVVDPGRPRVYARALRVWIYQKPSNASARLGYMRAGASSPTSPKPAGRDGCNVGWYPVEPEGYVCVGRRATLDANDPVVRATREYRPDPTRKLPYVYGTVRKPGPIYGHLPSDEELERAEPDIAERLEKWLSADGEVGASYAQDVWLGGHGELVDPAKAWKEKLSDALPSFLDESGQIPALQEDDDEDAQDPESAQGNPAVVGRMKSRVGYAFLTTFLWHGRRYGVTTDLAMVPTDRLRPIRGSDFHGFQIGKDVDFPFAIVRRPDAKLFIWQKSNNKLIDAGNAPYRGGLALTGKQQFFKHRLHYETKDGKWISDRDASRLDPARRMPAWGKNGEKWIDVNLTKQTLVLYEGEKPVYATLISSGEAGLEDPQHTTATKRGIFRIHTKHVSATMSSDEVGEEFELRDVPYVQYFDKGGYALHGAYWHDRFGVPKSHGCINLAPEDARRIFFWTEPRVPTGWHGVLLPLRGTVLFIHP
jgi:L,D-transpeptidase catalytic domain